MAKNRVSTDGLASLTATSLNSPVPSKPSQSAEDYLERIHELIESKGTAHVADIKRQAERLVRKHRGESPMNKKLCPNTKCIMLGRKILLQWLLSAYPP